jgi:hypothetical protein
MSRIVLPEKVILRLVDRQGHAICFRNVLFMVHVIATRKNNFTLGPFPSDENGIVTITKGDLLADAAAHYHSGLMDYDRIEDCQPDVKIATMSSQEVDRALESRTKVWTMLLGGEAQRWGSLEELRNVYRTAANNTVSAEPIAASWNGASSDYEYRVVTTSV